MSKRKNKANAANSAATGINRKKGQPAVKAEPETTREILKDLVTNPFEYKKDSTYLGKILGGICIFLAICLLFYITGHM